MIKTAINTDFHTEISRRYCSEDIDNILPAPMVYGIMATYEGESQPTILKKHIENIYHIHRYTHEENVLYNVNYDMNFIGNLLVKGMASYAQIMAPNIKRISNVNENKNNKVINNISADNIVVNNENTSSNSEITRLFSTENFINSVDISRLIDVKNINKNTQINTANLSEHTHNTDINTTVNTSRVDIANISDNLQITNSDVYNTLIHRNADADNESDVSNKTDTQTKKQTEINTNKEENKSSSQQKTKLSQSEIIKEALKAQNDEKLTDTVKAEQATSKESVLKLDSPHITHTDVNTQLLNQIVKEEREEIRITQAELTHKYEREQGDILGENTTANRDSAKTNTENNISIGEKAIKKAIESVTDNIINTEINKIQTLAHESGTFTPIEMRYKLENTQENTQEYNTARTIKTELRPMKNEFTQDGREEQKQQSDEIEQAVKAENAKNSEDILTAQKTAPKVRAVNTVHLESDKISEEASKSDNNKPYEAKPEQAVKQNSTQNEQVIKSEKKADVQSTTSTQQSLHTHESINRQSNRSMRRGDTLANMIENSHLIQGTNNTITNLGEVNTAKGKRADIVHADVSSQNSTESHTLQMSSEIAKETAQLRRNYNEMKAQAQSAQKQTPAQHINIINPITPIIIDGSSSIISKISYMNRAIRKQLGTSTTQSLTSLYSNMPMSRNAQMSEIVLRGTVLPMDLTNITEIQPTKTDMAPMVFRTERQNAEPIDTKVKIVETVREIIKEESIKTKSNTEKKVVAINEPGRAKPVFQREMSIPPEQIYKMADKVYEMVYSRLKTDLLRGGGI